MIRTALFAAALTLPCGAHAQGAQLYAGLDGRPVKVLSASQVADLRAGRGMGLALAAELNGYPGPSHTLEHADALALTPEQRARTAALFAAMKAEAVPLGERLIVQETTLEALFAERRADAAGVAAATAAIGATQGDLRAAHLRYHLAMKELLSPDQVRRYAELRGYTGDYVPGGHGGHAR